MAVITVTRREHSRDCARRRNLRNIQMSAIHSRINRSECQLFTILEFHAAEMVRVPRRSSSFSQRFFPFVSCMCITVHPRKLRKQTGTGRKCRMPGVADEQPPRLLAA